MKRSTIKSQKGFTLIELVIAITILSILAVTGVQMYGNVTTKAKVQTDFDSAQAIGSAIGRAIADSKVDSTAAAGETINPTTAAHAANTVALALINGKYLTNIPTIKVMRAGATWNVIVDAPNGDVKVRVSGNTGSGATQTIQLYPKLVTYTTTQAPYDLFNN